MTGRPGASALPTSVTSLAVNLAGLVSFSAVLALYGWEASGTAPAVITVMCIAAFALPIAILDLLVLGVHRRPSTGLDFSAGPRPDRGRLFVKLIGFYATLAVVAAAYWLLPEYGHDYYASFWQAASAWGPVLAIGAVPYFAVIDRYMTEPRDGYWQAGLLALGRWQEIDGALLRKHALEWVVKAFFLPLMFFQLALLVDALTKFNYAAGFLGDYDAIYDFLYAIDTVVAVVGYLFTLRFLDAHLRSVDETVSGWLVTIICYGPFWVFAWAAIFNYERNGTTWGPWLTGHPLLQMMWGSAILIATALYAGAHLTFGLRFSNLTHRGILTNGLYALTKHPSYVAKNISWWLISTPFIATSGWPDALRNSLLLLAVNVVYFLRARTEERHLARDPDYVRYALAMNERSLFAPLGRAFPALRFRPPAAATPLPERRLHEVAD
jgi:isoprenylcysteine carboxyl methyltransferase (ICMT) family protein YpbQ